MSRVRGILIIALSLSLVDVYAQNIDENIEKIKLLMSKKEYEKAASLSSRLEGAGNHIGYRIVASMLFKNKPTEKELKLIKKFYKKGCENYYDVPCVDYGLFLEKEEKYIEAESVYVEIGKKNQDLYSAKRLYYLYKNNKWDGYDMVKSDLWKKIYIGKMNEKKIKSNQLLRKLSDRQ